jgi:DNA-binding transcriptional ArsR family regulator
MVERDEEERLTTILKAASDASRRRILTLLVREGPLRVTELASYFDISLNAVSKHIKVLEAAGLVSRMKDWREHVIRAELENLREIDRWFAALRWVWEIRLERLETIVTEETDNDRRH